MTLPSFLLYVLEEMIGCVGFVNLSIHIPQECKGSFCTLPITGLKFWKYLKAIKTI